MKRASSEIGSDKVGSSEIWSVKLKRLYNKTHEGSEVTTMLGGADDTGADSGVAYSFLITLLG